MPAAPQESRAGTEARGARRMVQIFISLAGAELLTRALLFAAALIIVRALKPDAFGAFAYAVALASVVNFVIDLGLTALVTRDISADPGRAATLLGAFLKTQSVLAFATLGAGSGLAYLGVFGGPASSQALTIGFAAMAVSSLGRPFEATLTGRGKAHLLTAARAVRGAALIAVTLGVAFVDATPEAFLGALLASETIGVLTIGALCSARSTRPVFTSGTIDLRRMLRLAVPFALLAGFSILYLRVDILMLGQLDTEVAVGNYGLSSRIIDTAVIVPAYFGSAFLATVAQTGAETVRARVQTAAAIRHVLLLCVPLAFALAVGADPFIRLVAGDDYGEADEVLVLLSPLIVLLGSYSVLANLQMALNHIGLLVKIIVVGLAFKVALNAYAIPAHGAKGAAVSAVIAEAFVVVAQWFSARSHVDLMNMLAYLGRLAVSTAAMLAVALLLLGPLPWTAALCAGLIVFFGTSLLVGFISMDELRMVGASLKSGTASARSAS